MRGLEIPKYRVNKKTGASHHMRGLENQDEMCRLSLDASHHMRGLEKQNGKVVCYADSVLLKNVSFKVSESSRKRVLNTKQRNVHAYAVGELVAFNTAAKFEGKDISYNPYYAGFFYYKDDKSDPDFYNTISLNRASPPAPNELHDDFKKIIFGWTTAVRNSDDLGLSTTQPGMKIKNFHLRFRTTNITP